MRMILILGLIVLLGAGLTAVLKCRFEECVLLGLCLIVAVAYGCALLGALWLAPYLTIGMAAAGGLYAAWQVLINRKVPLGHLLYGACFFAAAALMFWWLCRGCALSDWDDFSHWGESLKIVFYSDALYTLPDSPDGFKSYPPATVLLQYTLMKAAGGGFREDLALFVHNLITAAAAVFPLSRLPRRRFAGAAVMVPMLALMPAAVYSRCIYMLGVDSVLGVLAAVVLTAEFLPDQTRASRWLVCGGCFMLTLTKSSGAGLAVMIGLLIAVKALLRRNGRTLRQIGSAAVPLLITLAAKGSWNLHLRVVGAEERWQSSEGGIQGLWAMLCGNAPEYRSQVWQAFWNSILFEKNYGSFVKFPFAGWLVLGCAVAVLLWFAAERQSRHSLLVCQMSAVGMAVIYTVSLLYTYLFVFSPQEAVVLASISRYLNTCVTLLVYVSVSLLCVTACRTRAIGQLVPAACLLALVLLADAGTVVSQLTQAPIHAAQTNHDRYLTRRAAQRINALGEASPRLYLITANDAGLTQLMVDYELLPVVLPTHNSILMTECTGKEAWVKHCTWQQWLEELRNGFDYVYIFCPEDQFVREFLPAFEDESQVVVDRMFRVVELPDGSVTLRTMPEITADQPSF